MNLSQLISQYAQQEYDSGIDADVASVLTGDAMDWDDVAWIFEN